MRAQLAAVVLGCAPCFAGLWTADFANGLGQPVAQLTIHSDTRQLGATIFSPWEGVYIGWNAPGAIPMNFTYFFGLGTLPVVAEADMPALPSPTATALRLWRYDWFEGEWAMIQGLFTSSFVWDANGGNTGGDTDPDPEPPGGGDTGPNIPEPASSAVFAALGLVAFGLRRKLRHVVPLLALTTLALAEPVEVVTQNVNLQTRSYITGASAVYALDQSGKNVVLVQLVLTTVQEKSGGGAAWEKVSSESKAYTRTGAEAWVATYTNAQGVVVTNNVKASFLADLARIELLPARQVQFAKIPQATAASQP